MQYMYSSLSLCPHIQYKSLSLGGGGGFVNGRRPASRIFTYRGGFWSLLTAITEESLCSILDVMAVYKSIFGQKKKQRSKLSITMFLVRTKTPAATAPPPAASPASSSKEQLSCDLILFCTCAIR